MKPELDESLIYSAYLDSDGSLNLHDKNGNDLEGWPRGWPEHIACVTTFLRVRGINLVNPPTKEILEEVLLERPRYQPKQLAWPPLVLDESIGCMGDVRRFDTDVPYIQVQPVTSNETNKARNEQRQAIGKRVVESWNLVMEHSDLSQVEVHEKSAMNEARDALTSFWDYLNRVGHTATAREVRRALDSISPPPIKIIYGPRSTLP